MILRYSYYRISEGKWKRNFVHGVCHVQSHPNPFSDVAKHDSLTSETMYYVRIAMNSMSTKFAIFCVKLFVQF